MTPSPHSRRRLLQWLAGTLLPVGACPLKAQQARQPVVVLTSYPDEVVSRVEAAFEKVYPGYRMQVVWRMPHDALPYLQQPRQSGVDVYWSASPRTFAAAKQSGVWRALDISHEGLPPQIGRTRITDSDGFYTATEVAGYGFAVHTAALAQLRLPAPQDWTDLTNPLYAGRIALPIPERVGFAPPFVEIVLQAYGWERGWALWSEIAGNARMVGNGATFVTDEVGSGRCVLGLSIDFFVVSAIAKAGRDSPLRFVYPAHSGINPWQIALTAQSGNPVGGRAFAEFILSEAGQRILAHPDIKKLPARPSVYAGLPAGTHNPFAAADAGAYEYDGLRAQPRLALSASVFQQMLVEDHEARARLWQRLHSAEVSGRRDAPGLLAARHALGRPPLSEAAAADTNLLRRFRERLEGSARGRLLDEEQAWRRHSQACQQEADTALRDAGA